MNTDCLLLETGYKRLLLDKYKNIYILGTEIEDKEDRIGSGDCLGTVIQGNCWVYLKQSMIKLHRP